MRERKHRVRRAVSVAAVLAFASGPALADLTKGQCVDANGKGQELRDEGKLAAAREQLLVCGSPSCPAIVRNDCAWRLDELEKAQPTIAFEVKDASGDDVSRVKVTVDGKLLAEKLDGIALSVDRGEHVFQFEVAGQPPVTRTLILTEGEKSRRERIILGAAELPPLSHDARTPPVPRVDPSAIDPASAGGGLGWQRTLGLVAGGAGIVATAVGVAFGVVASSEWTTATNECPTHEQCAPEALNAHHEASASATVSTIAFIAGGTLAAAGVTLFVTAPKADHATVAVTLAPVGLGLLGNF